MAMTMEHQKSVPRGNASALPGAVVLHDPEFAQFSDLIYRIAGISMAPTKKPLVSSRLAKRLKHHGLDSYGD